MTEIRQFRKRLFSAVLGAGLGFWIASAAAQDLRLAAPQDMIDSGFLSHLLPRFKLKHRIAVVPVPNGQQADMALDTGQTGIPVFGDAQGNAFRLVLLAETDATRKFHDWLQSDPGRGAIAGFPRGGPPAYTTELKEETVETGPEITGDAALGSKLALVHCGRCHVVDKRNRMGGIGSTPSFAAMRARAHWVDLFTKFWSENPHPSFTEVIGVTEPFSETRVAHVAPMRVTPGEIDAIVAFVETLKPLNLGGPVAFD